MEPPKKLVRCIVIFMGTSVMHRQKDSFVVDGRIAVYVAQFVPHETTSLLSLSIIFLLGKC
jgi:hypothetical protein